MATTTLKDGRAVTTNANSYASNAFTPAAGDLLVVAVVSSGSVAGLTMTDSQTLGWTQILTQTYNSSGQIISFWVANAFAAASSMTITYGATGSPTGCITFVWAISGMTRKGAAAIRQKTSATFAAAGTPAPAFAVACDTTSVTLGCAGNVSTTAAITPNASWTETATIGDIGYNTPATGGEACQRDSGFTGTTVTYGGTSPTAGAVIMVELDTSTPISVQSKLVVGTASSTTFAATFPGAVVPGATLWCWAYWNSSTSTATVSDDVNGSWVAFGTPLRGAGTLASFSTQAFYCLNSKPGTPTVTVTVSSASTDYGVAIHELPASGVDATAASYSNYSGTTPVTSALTPTANRSYVVGAAFIGPSWDKVVGGGFSVEEGRTVVYMVTVAKSVSPAASSQASFGTTASGNDMTFIAAFQRDKFPPNVASRVPVQRAATW